MLAAGMVEGVQFRQWSGALTVCEALRPDEGVLERDPQTKSQWLFEEHNSEYLR